ncbi:MAG TPA: hypothetical protein VK887_00020 [Pseudonocardiaceae bacterium]|nr:hypothetical protein [Pseudonocardiaceae bacterium]
MSAYVIVEIEVDDPVGYQEVLPFRLRASRGRMIAVEGSEVPAD